MSEGNKDRKKEKRASKVSPSIRGVNLGGRADDTASITGNRNRIEPNKYNLNISGNVYGVAQGDQARTEVKVNDSPTFLNHPLNTPNIPPPPIAPLSQEEWVISGDEPRWVPTNLVLGAVTSRVYEAVGLLRVPGKSYGTAWLIAPHLAITNYHVICNPTTSKPVSIDFDTDIDFDVDISFSTSIDLGTGIDFDTSEKDLHRNAKDSLVHFNYYDEGAVKDTYKIARLVQYNKFLDYAILALDVANKGRQHQLEKRKPLTLNLEFSARPGESLNIVQHPDGKAQKVAFRENTFLGFVKEPELNNREVRLRYKTDTNPGSSGSPVCDNNWQVVGLHYLGSAANQGTLMNVILEDLNEDLRAVIATSSQS